MKKSESLKLLNASMSCNGLHSTQPFTKLEKVALRIMEAKLKNPETTHSKSSPQMALEMLLECEHLSREEEPLKPVMLDVPENGLIWCEDIEPSNKPRPETKVFHIPLETEDGYIIEEVVCTAQDIAEKVALKKHKGSVLNYSLREGSKYGEDQAPEVPAGWQRFQVHLILPSGSLMTVEQAAEDLAHAERVVVLNRMGCKVLRLEDEGDDSPKNFILHIEFPNLSVKRDPQQVRHTDTSRARAVSYVKTQYPQGKLVRLERVQEVPFQDIKF